MNEKEREGASMFAMDRDIAQVEPNVFRDFVWLGQLISRGTASINETLLEASAQDTSFLNNAIELGSVVTINGVSLEIVEALSSSMLHVARLRESIDVPVRPTIDIASSPFHITTFRPQLEWVHRQVLAMLGLAPAGTGDQVRTSETRVRNPWEFVRVEVYGTLHHIYAAAGSALQFDHPLNQRAAMFRQMFRDERLRIVAQIDLDGDGQPDVLRRMNVGQLVRL